MDYEFQRTLNNRFLHILSGSCVQNGGGNCNRSLQNRTVGNSLDTLSDYEVQMNVIREKERA